MSYSDDIMSYVLQRVPPPQPGLPRPRFSLYLSSLLQYGVILVYHRQCALLLRKLSTDSHCPHQQSPGPPLTHTPNRSQQYTLHLTHINRKCCDPWTFLCIFCTFLLSQNSTDLNSDTLHIFLVTFHVIVEPTFLYIFYIYVSCTFQQHLF